MGRAIPGRAFRRSALLLIPLQHPPLWQLLTLVPLTSSIVHSSIHMYIVCSLNIWAGE